MKTQAGTLTEYNDRSSDKIGLMRYAFSNSFFCVGISADWCGSHSNIIHKTNVNYNQIVITSSVIINKTII